MEITVTGRHLEITDPIKDYAIEKVSKLPRYYDRVQMIEVIADKVADTFVVEVIVDVERHEDFVSKVKGTDLYGCIDDAVNKLERQLTDHKEKVRNRKHPARG